MDEATAEMIERAIDQMTNAKNQQFVISRLQVRFLSPAPKYPGSFITAGIFLYQSYIL